MQQQIVVDQDGEWFVNQGAFPFTDPTSGVRFEPSVQVKVKRSDWMKGQPVIAAVPQEKPAEKPEKEPTKKA